MKINLRATYTLNGRSEQSRDIVLDIPEDCTDDQLDRFTLMSKAADTPMKRTKTA